MSAILVIEDDRMLGEAIAAVLRQDGWEVARCETVEAADALLVNHAFSAVLLDLGLNKRSGMDVLAAMRSRYDATPVLIITARDQLSDRVRGLDGGADDYIVKPFQRDELLARLRAVVRRSRGQVTQVLRWRDVEVNPAEKSVTRAGERVSLSSYEYRTLLALMEANGRLLSREFLETYLYHEDDSVGSNTVAVFIHQLRRKLGQDVVVTAPGYGYRIGES